MKKIIFALALCFFLSVFVCADPGDIAGKYYATDIITSLNGVEIEAINIGGQTYISAEDMRYYSFRVVWNESERSLKIDSIPHAENGIPPIVDKTLKKSGTVLGNYYETDIVTYLDAEPISAINVGGRTYIHAEQMRKFGYEVIWNADVRTLDITSPDRCGRIWAQKLSYGVEQYEMATGAFSIIYNENNILGAGDYDYFDLTIYSNSRDYTFNMAFYQYEGLFCSTDLINIMNSLCYTSNDGEIVAEAEDKYEIAAKTLNVSVNGKRAEKIEVSRIIGNGHIDYNIKVLDIGKYKLQDIYEIKFGMGETVSEMSVIDISDEKDSRALAFEKVKKYPHDFIKSEFISDNYVILYVRESKSLGDIVDRLYIVDLENDKASPDILESVRAFEGFNAPILNPFAFKTGDVKKNFFFSCTSDGKTKDFYVDTENYQLYEI